MKKHLLAIAGVTALTLSIAACSAGGGGADGGEIVITCESCPKTAADGDTFAQYRMQLWKAFNEEYKGKYRVEPKPYTAANEADSAQHFLRAAATNTLPDLFVTQANVIVQVGESGGLMDFTDALNTDTDWKDSFQANSFNSLTNPEGQILGIPEQVDAIGIYYNTALFDAAGIKEFPTTWDDFFADAEKLKASGVIPLAMDGDWVTQLMWANLIGTQPGGADFLESGIKDGGFADNKEVVSATEYLKSLHTAGLVNEDAFTGDYNRAAAPFLEGQAAMIANGPWMSPNIADAGITAGYAPAPEDGVIVLAGNAGWASGAKDADKQEAVTAFMKFMTSDDQEFKKVITTGSYWPTNFEPTADQVAQLEPLGYGMFQAAQSAKYTYPHAKFATPPAFTTAWINNWPAYVQDAMSTTEFLDSLSEAVENNR
ncbi:ABC transporter substrate-binding protein [Microbacterium sp. NPDC058389]|uniref:ABC transporter substrate-binding protein n=1 Tax=Microbacterium sp. NPDC058389 TaxID=3346475 RepID=UPI0036500C4A